MVAPLGAVGRAVLPVPRQERDELDARRARRGRERVGRVRAVVAAVERAAGERTLGAAGTRDAARVAEAERDRRVPLGRPLPVGAELDEEGRRAAGAQQAEERRCIERVVLAPTTPVRCDPAADLAAIGARGAVQAELDVGDAIPLGAREGVLRLTVHHRVDLERIEGRHRRRVRERHGLHEGARGRGRIHERDDRRAARFAREARLERRAVVVEVAEKGAHPEVLGLSDGGVQAVGCVEVLRAIDPEGARGRGIRAASSAADVDGRRRHACVGDVRGEHRADASVDRGRLVGEEVEARPPERALILGGALERERTLESRGLRGDERVASGRVVVVRDEEVLDVARAVREEHVEVGVEERVVHARKVHEEHVALASRPLLAEVPRGAVGAVDREVGREVAEARAGRADRERDVRDRQLRAEVGRARSGVAPAVHALVRSDGRVDGRGGAVTGDERGGEEAGGYRCASKHRRTIAKRPRARDPEATRPRLTRRLARNGVSSTPRTRRR